MNIISPEEVVNLTKDLATEYCTIRYKHEVELSNFKNSFKEEMKNYVDDLHEEGISRQKLDAHRVIYERSLITNEYNNPNEKRKTPTEIAEISYNSILNSLDTSNSNASYYHKQKYIEQKQDVLRYYIRYLEIQEATRNLKETQATKLAEITEEIRVSGIPLYIIKYIYKCLKNDFINKKKSPSEFNHCKMMYDLIRDELIEKLETIEAEEKIDLNKIKQVHITREEAITRISSIVNLIEEENFETLKDHSIKDEIWFSLDYIEKYIQLLYKYKKYYFSKYGELNEWSDEKLCYVVNLPGFRFAKKEEYFIRR